MFDFSCQPPVPLVKGLPISLDVTHSQIQVASLDDPAAANDSTKKSQEMPVTLLVPDPRNQTARVCLNFSQIVKSIMLLAYLGQKKSSKHLKDVAKESQCPVQTAAGLGRTRER